MLQENGDTPCASFQMIRTLNVNNFRCFRELSAADCGLVNVIVGDNGVGKTTILEAIFAALNAGTDIAIRYRQQRGLEGNFTGSPKVIEDAIFSDLFFQKDTTKAISIELSGDGPEARSLYISRSQGGTMFLPAFMGETSGTTGLGTLLFQWKDATGNVRPASFQINPNGSVGFGNTGEDLPDFFYFSSMQPIGAQETAGRFSELSKARRSKDFVGAFVREYPWIEDLNIEVVGGAPVLHATVTGIDEKIPVANVSGAISRIIAILLAITAHPGGVVLVDELENGVYYKHYGSVWRSVLSFCRSSRTQIFTTTHSLEWLTALVEAAGKDVSDIMLWRVERSEGGAPLLRTFTGKQLKAGLEIGGELR
ncbi:AAA family ATPase [Rhizobium viscosum]|uniref:Energy-coupling factor transporter ATP-binding protein EcfA2 n=1 Tax=Rhizobium viscosum TaxID=1673 RepID=A0ABR9IS86_RHIVS|nr:ATP-binding protein [Rhizobium viscosum]MBE1506066.1 energy-coupling factor transporter ATP-binding protein EcfA2 [Rhizobium viscosum]